MNQGNSTPGRGPRLSRDQRREQLLDVTKRVVGEEGFHSVSIDRVAREAGISRPIIYEHFGDLGGLLAALLDREGARALRQLMALMPAPPEPGSGVNDSLLGALAAFLDAVHGDPVTWRLMLMPPEGAPPFLRERVDQARATVVAQLTSVLEASGGPDSRVTSPDPALTASSLQALADHWARLVLSHPTEFDRARVLRTARWALDRLGAQSA
jgi:AcrR family transcriptional regulator